MSPRNQGHEWYPDPRPREELHQFWRAFTKRPDVCSQVHPADAEAWPELTNLILEAPQASIGPGSNQQAVKSESTPIESALTPIPFVGDLALARIVVLMDHPAFASLDHEDELKGGMIRQALEATLDWKLRRDELMPFFPMNAEFSEHRWTDKWLEGGFGLCGLSKLQVRIAVAASLPVEGVRGFLGRRLAVLFATPYRSAHALPQRIFKLPSAIRARAVARGLLEEARMEKRILVLAHTRGRFGYCFRRLESLDWSWTHRYILSAPPPRLQIGGLSWPWHVMPLLAQLNEDELKRSAHYSGHYEPPRRFPVRNQFPPR